MENNIKNKTRILIGLDFDGVLHVNKHNQFCYVENVLESVLELSKEHLIDIVITSNWRHSSNKSFFSRLGGLVRYIIGQTPNIGQEKRDEEFLTFKSNYEKNKNIKYDGIFCIDDNASYFSNWNQGLFLVDKKIGFTEDKKEEFLQFVKNHLDNHKKLKL